MGQVTLQRPKFAYCNGAVRPWEEAVLHISSEAVLRSANVYEGIKGYWQPDGTFALVHLRRHYDRLVRSARALWLPVPVSYEEFEEAIFALVTALLTPDRDLWVRANIFAVEGHWGLDTVCDLMMTAFGQDQVDPEPIEVGVSTWLRPPDLSFPARVKTTANYQIGRLARIEGRGRGYGEMILLNQHGRVAEATGSCLLMTREGRVYTPPATEGALESITRGDRPHPGHPVREAPDRPQRAADRRRAGDLRHARGGHRDHRGGRAAAAPDRWPADRSQDGLPGGGARRRAASGDRADHGAGYRRLTEGRSGCGCWSPATRATSAVS
jgi:branched-subunit amino acid aminotransferase/4-amino-4-deoxychorismate lyase